MSAYQFFAGPTGALVPVSVDVECQTDADAFMVPVRIATTLEDAEVMAGGTVRVPSACLAVLSCSDCGRAGR